MEDIMKKRIIESVGKEVKIVLQNNFIYAGKITGCDDTHLEILDYKTNSYHVFDLNNIKDCEVKA
jgi:small nuclear ribonucleoprotein (snRNP)-like protein